MRVVVSTPDRPFRSLRTQRCRLFLPTLHPRGTKGRASCWLIDKSRNGVSHASHTHHHRHHLTAAWRVPRGGAVQAILDQHPVHVARLHPRHRARRLYYRAALICRTGLINMIVGRMRSTPGFGCLFGSIPVIGDAFDFAFKSHKKNAAILRSEFERLERYGSAKPQPSPISRSRPASTPPG